MPHIAVMMYPGRDEATKKKLAEALQKAAMEAMNMPASALSVSVEDVAKEQFDATVAAKVNHDDLLIASDFVK
ncbi:MAG: 4-oxalocrotonate tautomerase family protein [Oscillospiraceae bacterium]